MNQIRATKPNAIFAASQKLAARALGDSMCMVGAMGLHRGTEYQSAACIGLIGVTFATSVQFADGSWEANALLVGLLWIVVWIDVRHVERPAAANLNYRRGLGGHVMVVLSRKKMEPAGSERMGFAHFRLVAQARNKACRRSR